MLPSSRPLARARSRRRAALACVPCVRSCTANGPAPCACIARARRYVGMIRTVYLFKDHSRGHSLHPLFRRCSGLLRTLSRSAPYSPPPPLLPGALRGLRCRRVVGVVGLRGRILHGAERGPIESRLARRRCRDGLLPSSPLSTKPFVPVIAIKSYPYRGCSCLHRDHSYPYSD